MEESAWRRVHGGECMEESAWRRVHGGECMEESAWRRVHHALGLRGSWGHRKYFASRRKNGLHQILRNSRGSYLKVGPDIKVQERLGITSRQ